MKRDQRTGQWLLVVTLAAVSAWACSDDDDDSPGNTGGGGGTADGGKGGSGGKAGSKSVVGGEGGIGGPGAIGGAGTGGGAGADNQSPTQVATCGPYPLEQLCAQPNDPCPGSAAALTANGKCPGTEVQQYASTCGGVVVVAEQDIYGSISWSFDSDGALTGVVFNDDVATDCSDDTVSFTKTYGESCTKVGGAELLCGDGGAGAGGSGGAGGSE